MKPIHSITTVLSCLAILVISVSSHARYPAYMEILNFQGEGIRLRHRDSHFTQPISLKMRVQRLNDAIYVPPNNFSRAFLDSIDDSPVDHDGMMLKVGPDKQYSEYRFPCIVTGRNIIGWKQAGIKRDERSCKEGVSLERSSDIFGLWKIPSLLLTFQANKHIFKARSFSEEVIVVPGRESTLVQTANLSTGVLVNIVLGDVNIKSTQHPQGRQVKAGERYSYPEDEIIPIDHYQLLTSPEIQDFLNPNNWLSPNLPDRVFHGIEAQLAQQRAQQRAALKMLLATRTSPSTVSFTSLKLNPNRIRGGLTAQGWVELSEPAPAGGAVVRLASNNPRIARVPNTVTVPTGKTSTFFDIPTARVTSSQQVEIAASYARVNRETLLVVEPQRVPPSPAPSPPDPPDPRGEIPIEDVIGTVLGEVLNRLPTSESPPSQDTPSQNIPSPAPSPPDPAAQRIDFRLVSRESQFQGRVRIVGIVQNIGQGAFESRRGQQAVQLYENSQLIASTPFQNLSPGQEVEVTYERNWNTSSPSEGEFPPTYRLVIRYDPYIRMDDNPQNDDTNNSNNTKERSGSDIHNLFRVEQEEGPI